jgi:endoglucanase
MITVNCLGLVTAIVFTAAPTLAAGSDPATSIRLNQLGFQPNGPKRAIVIDSAAAPLKWRLLDASETVKAQGETRVFGNNAGSGEHVHILDFSAFDHPGSGYRLVVNGSTSHPFSVEQNLFNELKYDALAYFYHNRSGIPIEVEYVNNAVWARPAGHPSEIVSCFNRKDQRGREWQGCGYQLDATGGWYDAGDHGKYVVNAGIAVWTLLNYYERARRLPAPARDAFADSKVSIPERGNGIDDLLDEVRWELRFVLGMQAPEGAKLKLLRSASAEAFEEIDVSGMAHHKLHGEQWTAMPSAPHEDTKPRYAYPPTTTATLNLAANAAQCARVWRDIDKGFADRCLLAAKRAFSAAQRHPDLLPVGGFSGGGGYGDRETSDEFYWAAVELFITTGEKMYLDIARASPHYLSAPGPDGARDMSWSQVATLGTLSLVTAPNALPRVERAQAVSNVTAAADVYLRQAKQEGYAIPYTAAQYEWGSNSAILNHGIVLGVAYDLTSKPAYREGIVDALDYILGRNPMDQSYVSGHGAHPLRNPHHRFWAHQKNSAFPAPPPGALSGGPNSSNMSDPIAMKLKGSCLPQTCWADHIDAYALNEVAINWNAPLFWVAAFLDENN